MKFLVTTRPRPGVSLPDDHALTVFQQTYNWLNTNVTDGTFDCAYNFPAGGGLAIVNANSHETLTELLSAYPLQPWVEYEIHPLSDLKHGFDLTIKALGG